MPFDDLLGKVGAYYGDRLAARGATPAGVDWNSVESQQLRFKQLLRVCDEPEHFSLNDWGCGYGALYDFLLSRNPTVNYRGYDISESMVACARQLHPTGTFVSDPTGLIPADYTVASGIFNVKLATPAAEWREYVLHVLGELAAVSQRGFAFNMLTSYSDAEKMRSDLYYGDPTFFFDHCKSRFARRVALLHDYPLYEFTMLVRVDP